MTRYVMGQISFLLPLLIVTVTFGAEPHSESEAATSWRTGPEFRRQLQLPVGFRWSEVPLRQALRNLSMSQRVAIFLDRRIDPGQPINLSVRDRSMDAALQQLAAPLNAGISYLDPVVYLGPPEVADKLSTLAALRRDEVKQLPPDARSRWLQAAPWHWDHLARPRQLLEQLGEATGFRTVNADAIPHDLWPEVSLPEMTVCDRLSLILAGFSLTFEISPDGSAIQLIPIPEEVSLERTYRPAGDVKQAAEKLAGAFPEVSVQRAGPRLRVQGGYEDHRRIRRWLQGESPDQPHADDLDQRYTLNIENTPAGGVIKALADQLQLSVEIAPEVRPKLQQRISFRVENVELTELFHAALDPIDVPFQLEEKKLVVGKRPR